jgi:4-hydroxy-3-polyprenylbenzoate decarboxylase
MKTNKTRKIAVALTGASGAAYFLRLIERIRSLRQIETHLIASASGRRVLLEETGLRWQDIDTEGFVVHDNKDNGAQPASGSFRLDALAIVPCSMHTLASIAAGLAQSLIHRTAAVQLKESRRLILVPREAPLSLLNLRAMTALAEAGALVLPACPGFYHRPQTIDDLLDSVVDRVLDHLQIDDPEIRRWKA